MERSKLIIKIVDFTKYPGPRYSSQGEFSGEEFYHKILNPDFVNALKENRKLQVVLDGTAGYASSFLDEAFGNLIFDFSLHKVEPIIEIISEQEPDWKTMIFNDVFIDWEKRRNDNSKPKKTVEHPEWYRFINDSLEIGIWK